jgi:hypothetical protein
MAAKETDVETDPETGTKGKTRQHSLTDVYVTVPGQPALLTSSA